MGTSSRLGVDDWLQAGYATVADEGLSALKLDRLCSRLNVTKGSFYWHFVDMAAYRQALIESWTKQKDDELREIEQLGDTEPRERLSQMIALLIKPRHWTLERAMREWARSDKNIAAAVQAADRRLFEQVRKAFRDYGFGTEEADLRAGTTFAAGIGLLHLSVGTPQEQQLGKFTDFLLRP
ncbi:TetR/AcrR family transcriptional regulator [Mycobacterium gordonae]|uniref:TetR family transcriptional regulator n=1 Tax=Mycobacterium gordonae TaxID=1778 RepID=A0A1X1WZJ6_MYCGO|nr:TetR/AcrR family transcriptional regulator [Mycobacterium gordonae]MCQ4365439.1 TetR/AcrR family transcriptional regulator [Mycobacterium gordonae]MCV7004740.1 TetR/AcrR family transcriptional regulator [Mycobacterium gordonae]ODR20180.1 TetR family transcriptional regulator [Mycobacterium gordonae]ORV91850.1 TetR family transcriptional regulator [Mycobacterium gordonae]